MNNEKKPYSILFVEDETLIRNNYIEYLKAYFEEVYEASNGESALEIYKNKKPDIMIIDINIPKMNGLELLKKIRENDHSTKAIMLTANSDLSNLLKASELKLTKYLVKPITRADLKNVLSLAIEEILKFKTKSTKTYVLKENYVWDYELHELFNNNVPIKLTEKEKKLLELFFNNLNNVLTYSDISMDVWDDFESDNIESVKTFIKKLRKKLPENTIVNVYGLGYKIVSK